MPPKANGVDVPTPDGDNTTEHDEADAAPDAATMPNVPLHQVLRMMGEKKALDPTADNVQWGEREVEDLGSQAEEPL